MKRHRNSLLAAGLVLAPLASLMTPAQATPVGEPAGATQRAAACPRGTGVSVVVDFGAWHKISCAPGDPVSGAAALRGAGFTLTMVQRFPGAICRINGRPTVAQDACVVMPPATRYWSYWHAVRGGKWTYSTLGPGSYNPKPGTVEGWSYGAGTPPTPAPPA
jgi:hypothetical protein